MVPWCRDGRKAERCNIPALSYDAIAEEYASTVDTKPWNAYYERPAATLSLLPPLSGTSVLDVGCGSGWYAEHMVEQVTATVTCFDLTRRWSR